MAPEARDVGREPATPRRQGGRVEHVVLAPLRWLEQARGWRRRGLIVLYLLVVVVLGGAIRWATSLNGLPDIGDPFDVAAFRRSLNVPPDEDAFTLYREAARRLPEGAPIHEGARTPDPQRFRGDAIAGWSNAGPTARDQVLASREALDLWRRASERERAQAVPGGRFYLEFGLVNESFHPMMNLFTLTTLGILEATRLEANGDPAGAWEWYRAALRASRHVEMGGTSSHRSTGQVLASTTATHVARWAEGPGVDAALLRRALADVKAVVAMTPPNSDAIRADYLAMLRAVRNPEVWVDWDALATATMDTRYAFLNRHPGLLGVVKVWRREPSRSERVVRILYAHWLSQADLPPSRRMKMVETQVRGNHTHPDFPYYAAPGQRDAAHPMSPEVFYDWYRSTLLGGYICPPLAYRLPNMDRDRRELEVLTLILAEQLYLREHGSPPERNEDLVNAGYLERLPEGYENEELDDDARGSREPAP